jgi:hypothetical protein
MIAAVILAGLAVCLALVSVAYTRATARMQRAASLYAAGRTQEGDAEMKRGRELMRRVDLLVGALARKDSD